MVALNETRRSPSSTAFSALFLQKNPPVSRSSPAPRIPSLQRARYYDPSTGEFTSRDPLEYVDGMSVYRGYLELQNADSSGTIRIVLVDRMPENDNTSQIPAGDAHLHGGMECDKGARVRSVFLLDAPARSDGFIVQEVNVLCKIAEIPVGDKCCDGCDKPAFDAQSYKWTRYWEAWPVKKDHMTVDKNSGIGGAKDFDDQFSWPTNVRSCGHVKITGSARFYTNKQLGGSLQLKRGWGLDKEYGSHPCGPIKAGHILSTNGSFIRGIQFEPDFWRSTTPVETLNSPHSLEIGWKCCWTKKENVYPGNKNWVWTTVTLAGGNAGTAPVVVPAL